MADLCYKIDDGRIWDVAAAGYLAEGEDPPAGARLIDLRSAEGDGSEEYLIRTLIFYGYGLGAYEEQYGSRAALEIHRQDPAAHGLDAHLADYGGHKALFASHTEDAGAHGLAAHKADLAAHGNRVRLTGDLNIYVDKNHAQAGNDLITNRGTINCPFASVMAAIRCATLNYFSGDYYTYINVSGDEYAEDISVYDRYGPVRNLVIRTWPNASQMAVLKGAVTVSQSYNVQFLNLALKTRPGIASSSIDFYLFYAGVNSVVRINNVKVILSADFDARYANIFYANMNARLGIYNDAKCVIQKEEGFSKPVNAVLNAENAEIYYYCPFEITGGELSSLNCVVSINHGVVYGNKAFSGSMSGRRYLARLNGVIDTGSAGPEFFPGASAGLADLGGVYR